jgi:drug/metabolite transporter (DMT)-like permease
MSKKAAEWLLAGVIFARSTSLLFAKVGLESMSPLNLLAVRFCLAFAVLCVIFWKKLRHVTKTDLLHGMILGGAFFAVMTCEVFGLTMTTASTVSFLTNTAIVIVPLFEAVLHRTAPDRRALLCAAVTLAGVGFLTLKNGLSGFGLGEGLCLMEACLYAIAIILTAKFSHEGDAILLGMFQIGFLGLFAAIGSLLVETPHLPQNGTEWGVILALALVCSCFGFTFQPVAQRYTTADRAAQMCAINPLSTAVLSAIFLKERLGVQGVIGAALILLGIVMHNYHKSGVKDSDAAVEGSETSHAA